MLAGLLGLAACPALGQPAAGTARSDPFRVTAYWENDGGPIASYNNTDRHYTNGLALGVTHQPDWAADLAEFIPFHNAFGDANYGMGYIAGQLMITPSDLKRRDLIRDDRPYAGYLYGGAYFQRANDRTLDHLQLDLGMIGESAQADDLQRAIHATYGGVDPEGWDNQLHDEFTAQFTVRKVWKFDLIGALGGRGDGAFGVEVLPEAVGRLGTVWREVEGGATLRLGFSLPDDFGPGRIMRPADAVGYAAAGWSVYAYGRAAGRLIQHDTLLQGNNYRDSHGVDIQPFVGEFTSGVAVAYHRGRWAADVNYSYTIRTEEFDGQDEHDAFSALNVGVTYWFD